MMFSKKFLFLTSAILFIAFIFFSYLVAKERFTQFDFNSTVRLQDHIPRKFDLFFSLFSVLGSVEVTGVIWLIILFFTLIKRFFLTALSLFLLPLALAMELFGKLFVYHPSPPFLFYRGVLKIDFFPSNYVHTDYSYPSGHLTRTAFLVVFILAFIYFRFPKKNQAIILPILAGLFLIMLVSRVYLGEHWSSDVIGGSLIGTSFGILSALTIPKRKPVV